MKLVLKALLSFLVTNPFTVLPIVLVVVAAAGKKATALPRWASWYNTTDNDIDGPSSWRLSYPSWYWRRVTWLMRNRGHTFDGKVLGVWSPGRITENVVRGGDVSATKGVPG